MGKSPQGTTSKETTELSRRLDDKQYNKFKRQVDNGKYTQVYLTFRQTPTLVNEIPMVKLQSYYFSFSEHIGHSLLGEFGRVIRSRLGTVKSSLDKALC